jgi:predicted dinucleotide-binding enzyme
LLAGMRITVIGKGNIGGTLGTKWSTEPGAVLARARAGHRFGASATR